MRRRFTLSGLIGLLFVLTVGAGAASAQGNLSGKWALDRSRSTELGPVSGASMTITQSGKKVTVAQQITTAQGVMSSTDVYVLDGSTQGVMLDGPNGSRAKGKRTAKKIDGGFESVDEGTFKPDRFPEAVTVKTTRAWRLSSDGQTLTIELSRASKLGTQQARRVFARQ
ncbi:MAG TPA: hypothetical protein VNZ44_11185 [Pyrinomonadaceae bacterium]|nr:hypothetical protein [Pyrinomonadaceae bacterium]